MNITYLLGAGASYEALPIVEQIPDKLEGFLNQFYISSFDFVIKNQQKSRIGEKHLFRFNSIEGQKLEFEKIKTFHKDILWLVNGAKNHTSIDTFEKKLYLQDNHTDLKKLKYILSCFFIYEQTFHFDKRYDSFFASILESLSEIPSNLKILSWNYDSQLEIAFSRFSNKTIEESRDILNVFSKGNMPTSSAENLNNEFNVFKVNGTTNLKNKKNETYDLIEDYDIDEVNLVSSFLEIYSSRKLFSDYEPNMSFAWENFKEESKFYNNLQNSVEETETLVVIGYSFPFFNRKIDKFILDAMPKLKKIYVQDPKYSKDIIEKIKGLIPEKQVQHYGYLGPILYEPKTFHDQFFIPIEF
ncbi:hypothetical protein ABI125_01970 [Tamlana crocina]